MRLSTGVVNTLFITLHAQFVYYIMSKGERIHLEWWDGLRLWTRKNSTHKDLALLTFIHVLWIESGWMRSLWFWNVITLFPLLCSLVVVENFDEWMHGCIHSTCYRSQGQMLNLCSISCLPLPFTRQIALWTRRSIDPRNVQRSGWPMERERNQWHQSREIYMNDSDQVFL